MPNDAGGGAATPMDHPNLRPGAMPDGEEETFYGLAEEEAPAPPSPARPETPAPRVEPESSSAWVPAVPLDPLNGISVDRLELPSSLAAALRRRKIRTVGEVRAYSDADLRAVLKTTPQGVGAIRQAIARLEDGPAAGTPLHRLGLSPRIENLLRRARIETVEALREAPLLTLSRLHGLGRSGLTELELALADESRLAAVAAEPSDDGEATADAPPHPTWDRLRLPMLDIPTEVRRALRQHGIRHPWELARALAARSLPEDLAAAPVVQEVAPILEALAAAPASYLDWLESLPERSLEHVVRVKRWKAADVLAMTPWSLVEEVLAEARPATRRAIRAGLLPARYQDVAQELGAWLAGQPDREREFLISYHGLDGAPRLTLQAIADRAGLVRQRIDQVLDRLDKRLQDAFREGWLPQTVAASTEALAAIGSVGTAEAWGEALAAATSLDGFDPVALVRLLGEKLDGVERVRLPNAELYVLAPVTSGDVGEVRDWLDAYWRDHPFADEPTLVAELSTLLPAEVGTNPRAYRLLLEAMCTEPTPGWFSPGNWNLNDLCYFVLHRAGRKLHVEEIVRQIRALRPEWHVENYVACLWDPMNRSNSGIVAVGNQYYELEEWGGQRVTHLREPLLEYLIRQPLPVHVDDITAAIMARYDYKAASIRWTLESHPDLFQRFGRAPIFGVANRRYDLPDDVLVERLIAVLAEGPKGLNELAADPRLAGYSRATIEFYGNVHPLLCQLAGKNGKFALRVENRRHYEAGEADVVIAEIFGRIHEPLHLKDIYRMVRETFAYPPGDEPFRRVLVGEGYEAFVEHFYVPRAWLEDDTTGALDDLDRPTFLAIGRATLGQAPPPAPATALDWLALCHEAGLYYRGARVFALLDLEALPADLRSTALHLGQACQQRGQAAVLDTLAAGEQQRDDLARAADVETLRKAARATERAPSPGLAALADGTYEAHYQEPGVIVTVMKWGGHATPVARVLGITVQGEPLDPTRHPPLPGNGATPDERLDALRQLYARDLTAFGQVHPYLVQAIGPRATWSVAYRQLRPVESAHPMELTR